MKLARLLFGFVFLMTLVACSTSDEDKAQDEKDEAVKEQKAAEAAKAVDTYKPHLICPQVAVIRELDTVRDYAPDGKQLMDEARMVNITGDCSYHDDGIDIAFILHLTAGRGPQLNGNRVKLPYFVAVLDPDQTVLNKNEMNIQFEFGSDEKIITQDEPLHVFIPLPKDKNSTGPDYRVLTGFQLTEEQLKDVRQREKSPLPTLSAPAKH